ncbi:uncharacterized protein [Gossypium hirsutum]|uniref:Uncharacterized protein isoform X3 n=1 Tax=Gossypium hirsutum TaxID=3635 RepID=A0ABM2Z8K8_GOSHI|nr:uncharacterized protein LOC107918100 isoform X3 [Gossypium hirsutum]
MSCRLLDSSLEKYLHPKRLALGETNSHRNLKKNSPTLSFARDGVDLVVAFISIPYQFPNRSLMTSVYPLIPIRPDSPNGADKDAAFLLFTVQQYPAQLRNICSLVSSPCLHLGQMALFINLLILKFTRVGR